MSLLDHVRQLKVAGRLPTSNVERLAARLEKRASLDYGDIMSGAGGGALEGGISGGIAGAMHGGFSGLGWRGAGSKALSFGMVSAVPGAMFGAYRSYQGQKAREKALREYRTQNPYYAHPGHSNF